MIEGLKKLALRGKFAAATLICAGGLYAARPVLNPV
jgi:hypothetical protein